MKSKSICYIFLILFIGKLSSILSTTIDDVDPIDSQLEGGITFTEYKFEQKGDAYFSYEFPTTTIKVDTKMAFTIHNNINSVLAVSCIFSSSEKNISGQFSSETNICTTYSNSNSPIHNIIFSLSEFKSDSKLYLKITAQKTCTISIFFREADSYKTELSAMTLSNAFAYVSFEFNKEEFYKKDEEYLLSSSEANSILIYGEKNGKINIIDETPVLAISKQSLASIFWSYENIYFFIGKNQYNSLKESNDIEIKFDKNEDNNQKFYYYKSNTNFGFNSFYYYCTDDKTSHLLFVNNGVKDNKNTYYFKFHNLVGSQMTLFAEYPLGGTDSYNFSEVKRFNYFNTTDSHVHIFKMQCSGSGNKINANIKYNKKEKNTSNNAVYPQQMKDYTVLFGTNNFTLGYGGLESNEFATEIFTPGFEEKKTFKAIFENKIYEINNEDIFIFKITNKDIKTMTINTTESIETIITCSPTAKMEQVEDEYSIIHHDTDGNIYYSFYQIAHRYNANYNVSVELENKLNEKIPICFYLTTTANLANNGQNCFLINENAKEYIILNNIFKYDEENQEDFNLKEPQYYLVIYGDKETEELPSYYSITGITFETDLKKSTPINNIYLPQNFLYLNATLLKNKDSYFNINFNSKKLENHIDLYILSNTSQYEELKFDIKCIMRHEYAIDFIKDDFTEENNICFLMNNKDYKSNVFHIIFNNIKSMEIEYLIIKITPKETMDVRFVVKENELIDNSFKLDETVSLINEQSIYKISEIEKSYLESFSSKQIIFYNYDIDGIELYARKNNNFEQIVKGSFIILNIKETLEKYKDYDKFLIALGKKDCEFYCNTESKYQIKYIDNFRYIQLEDFNGEYHLPISKNNCKKDVTHYIILDYGQKYAKPLYVSKYTFLGNIYNNEYFDYFMVGNFENFKTAFSNFHELNLDKLHLHIIKFNCENNLFTYFDYFTKLDYPDAIINLEQGKMKYVVIPAGKNITFNYESINRIRIELISRKETDPIMYFENKNYAMETGHRRTFIRYYNDINLLYLAAPAKEDIPLRITTLINVENLPNAGIDNLYTFEDKLIYDVPKNVTSIIFTIKKISQNLRILLTEDEEMEICYNEAGIVLLEKNGINCFNLKDSYELEYKPAEPEQKTYLVFYPTIDNKNFNVSHIEVNLENGGDNDGEKNNNKDNNKKKGLKWYVILIIIILVLIIIIVVTLIIFRMKKTTVTSADIEKDNNANNEVNSSLSVIN